jgi:transposase-like protein
MFAEKVKSEAACLYMEELSLRVMARENHACKGTVRRWILKFKEAFLQQEEIIPKEELLRENKTKKWDYQTCSNMP